MHWNVENVKECQCWMSTLGIWFVLNANDDDDGDGEGDDDDKV